MPRRAEPWPEMATAERRASKPLSHFIGEMTDEQATRVLAIFNRHRVSREQPAVQPAQPDAA